MYKTGGAATQSHNSKWVEDRLAQFKQLSKEEQLELVTKLREARMETRIDALATYKANLQAQVQGTPTALTKRPADTQPGQPKISTASRQAKQVSAPLAAAPVKPGTATAQQPLKPPAAGQGTFKLSPAEMTKLIDAEVGKMIAAGVAIRVNAVRPSDLNQLTVYQRNLKNITAFLQNRLKELLLEPANKSTSDLVLKAAKKTVQKPSNESKIDATIREKFVATAITGCSSLLLGDEKSLDAINILTGKAASLSNSPAKSASSKAQSRPAKVY
ncbi:MAG: hypothetical protein AB7F64_06365 [Gammaproteobacteria bacterium]